MTNEPPSGTGQYQPFPDFPGWAADFDSSAVDAYAGLLAEAKTLATPTQLENAVQVATRYAAVDTGALEGLYSTNRGFTRTIAEQTATWEAALKMHGDHVERSIADALNGYEMVLDLATENRQVTESWIRQLHATVTASQETYIVLTDFGPQTQALPKGVYKAFPNDPTNADTGRVFHDAPPMDTPPEMGRLVSQLLSAAFRNAHPVVQAAYAHYAFVRVHPFADGNGRVARALASVYLYRNPGVPLVIFADQKDGYLDALEAADDGRPGAFVGFLGERTMDTIQLVRGALKSDSVRGERAWARLNEALTSPDGLAAAEAAALNQRLATLIRQALPGLFAAYSTPPSVSFVLTTAPSWEQAPNGYRQGDSHSVGYLLELSAPVSVRQSRFIWVWSAQPDTDGPDLLATASRSGQPLEVLHRDIEPRETEVLRIKIHNWLTALLSEDREAFGEEVHRELVKNGFQDNES